MRFLRLLSCLLLAPIYISAMTIDSVITLSDSCIQIEWTPDTINTDPTWYRQHGSSCTDADSIYNHCDFVAGRQYTGIAYSYGGEDPWFTFRQRLLSGFIVGSHQCHYENYGDPSNRVAGTDCSGFLSFVWNYPRSATSTFYKSAAFTSIPITQVQSGDALVKATSPCGYHAILIVEADDPAEAVISEASSVSFGCRERIVDLTSQAWQCYKAIRYPKLVSAVSRKTLKGQEKDFRIKIKQIQPGKLAVNCTPAFSGTLSGFLPDGTLLFKKHFDTSYNNFTIETAYVKSNMLIVEIKTDALKHVFHQELLIGKCLF